MSFRGFFEDLTYVVGSETSLPILKPVRMSALQRALMVLSKRPLVSAGACGNKKSLLKMTKIPLETKSWFQLGNFRKWLRFWKVEIMFFFFYGWCAY